MKWLRWDEGRQKSGYEKMLLATAPFPIPFDCYLIRYKVGSEIDWHTDPVPPGKKHYRLNIFLKQAKKGGAFEIHARECWKNVYSGWRWELFRPDIHPHRVTKIESGTRYVLSIGWLR